MALNSNPGPHVVEILLVEDNPGDVRLAQETLRDCKIANRVHVARDGEEALRYLFRVDEFAAAVRPDIIMLDLNLPKKDGRQVLAEIKTDADLRRIPVIVLTTSRAEQDILKAYDLQANCYITKPLDLDQYWKAMQSIERFWFQVVRLPPK
jgi:CheY-like chemotaxis protein